LIFFISESTIDPVSIFGLASGAFGIVDVITRTLVLLNAIRERWKEADFTVTLLISQLTTLKAALSQIAQ
jgi:hypothetical protein